MLTDSLLLVAGLALLFIGGDALVRGAARIAAALGLAPFVIGLTIVGFGTSAPELLVSVQAAAQGEDGIAIGNVVGSNIANLLLILGVAGVIAPLQRPALGFRRDAGVLLLVTALLAGLLWWGLVERWMGALLLAGLVAYLIAAVTAGRRQPEVAAAYAGEAGLVLPAAAPARRVGLRSLAAVALGLAALVGGAALLVDGATGLAAAFGVPAAIIGVSVVAVGTSLPELATSVVAAWRRQTDIAIGNVIGSNIFNVLGILGVSALVSPLTVPARFASVEIWVLLGATVLLVWMIQSGARLARWEAALALLAYGLYTASLVLIPLPAA